ncbi:hypothetical protein [Rhodococcus sp. NPDC003348]
MIVIPALPGLTSLIASLLESDANTEVDVDTTPSYVLNLGSASFFS